MLVKKSNFSINLIELKYRTFYVMYSLLVSFIVCFLYKEELFFFIANYFLAISNGFIYTGLFDPLIIYLKLSFIFSLTMSFPVIIYIYIYFFLRSLYSYYLNYFSLFCLIMYTVSFVVFLSLSKMILPVILTFLINFQQFGFESLFNLSLQATITQYYALFVSYLFVYFILILIPNLYLILVFLGILSKSNFLKHKFRKYLYLFVTIIFLLFAPPDFVLQLFILPFIFLILEFYIYIITFLYTLYFYTFF